MAIQNLHFIPVALFIIIPMTFIGTYIVAVWEGHVEPYVPYISDVGTKTPESCVFGQIINMCAVLLSVSVYIRYCHIYQYCLEHTFSPKVQSLNNAGVYAGLISCFGLSLVANFQETNVFVVHVIGAFMCFGVGTVYFWIQAVCSYHMQPVANTIGVARLRAVIAVICSVVFVIMASCGVTAHLQFHGSDPRKWYPKDGGWVFHVISSVSEWIMALCFCTFILSFSHEFRDVILLHPQLQLCRDHLLIQDDNDQAPIS
ncbi:DNA damage-regulated autophagy modulator protein 2 [Lycorma delicatula]|uniref:DNA damage-regulated autophagy modulator protein 2 n=1 Tax=Lycorma delicatula TaxID=130591 RepID=UPI003F519080